MLGELKFYGPDCVEPIEVQASSRNCQLQLSAAAYSSLVVVSELALLAQGSIDDSDDDGDGDDDDDDDSSNSSSSSSSRIGVLRLLLQELPADAPRQYKLPVLDGRISYGYTAYMLACSFGHFAAMKLLVEAGCSTELRNDFGKSGLDLAMANGHASVIAYLKNAWVLDGFSMCQCYKSGNEPCLRSDYAAFRKTLRVEVEALKMRPNVTSHRRDELQVAPDRLNFWPLTPFAHWTRIGGGAYGDIFSVEHVFPPLEAGDGEQVNSLVVKAVKADNDAEDEEEAIAALRSEIKALCSIAHEHIVRVYGFSYTERPETAQKSYVLLLEPCDGDLNDELYPVDPVTKKPTGALLGWDRKLSLALQMAQGMEAIHTAKQLHLDLKPGNILLRGGVVKIADFGMASADQNEQGTYDFGGQPTGTWDYMAPEAYRGYGLCEGSDVFSFGVMLWELMTQRRVHSGFEQFNSEYHTIEDLPKWMSSDASVRPKLPEASPEPWRLIMAACWMHETSQRLSFTAVRQALQLLCEEGVTKSWCEDGLATSVASAPALLSEWLKGLGVESAVECFDGYLQGELEELTVDDDDFRNFLEDDDVDVYIAEITEEWSDEDKTRFRDGVRVLGEAVHMLDDAVDFPGVGYSADKTRQFAKGTAMKQTVASWLPHLKLLSEAQSAIVLEYTTQAGTLVDLTQMDSDDFEDMMGELELESEKQDAFRAAVRELGEGQPEEAEAPESEEAGATRELWRWLEANHGPQWQQMQLLGENKEAIVERLTESQERLAESHQESQKRLSESQQEVTELQRRLCELEGR